MTKLDLLERGQKVMQEFCTINSQAKPEVDCVNPEVWSFGVCAYYRRSRISICVPKCAAIGVAGPAWSYPGYTVDRTPYGVVQHELGHHIDLTNSNRKGNYYGDFSLRMREVTGEKPITSYCPNHAEWFAEMFRVFITNPDLLRLVRPRTHREIASKFKAVFGDSWRSRMDGAPARTVKAAERQIEIAAHDQRSLI